MMDRDLLAMDHYNVVPFNATQPNPQRSGMSNTPRQVADYQLSFVGYLLHNNDASNPSWVQIFFKPSAEVMLGTTAPDFTVKLGSGESLAWDFLNPVRQGTGFTVAGTTTETGSTAPSSAVTGVFFFKPPAHKKVS